jgi:spore coat protein U-like protein
MIGRQRLQLLAAALLVLVSGTVASADCSISTAGVNFGNYDVFAAGNDDATGSVQISCSPREDVQVTLSRGFSSTYSPRQMRSGTNTLNYNLYLNAARTQIWGNGSGGTSVYNGNNIRNTTRTVYGRIPPAQDAATGSYSDNIIATVIF